MTGKNKYYHHFPKRLKIWSKVMTCKPIFRLFTGKSLFHGTLKILGSIILDFDQTKFNKTFIKIAFYISSKKAEYIFRTTSEASSFDKLQNLILCREQQWESVWRSMNTYWMRGAGPVRNWKAEDDPDNNYDTAPEPLIFRRAGWRMKRKTSVAHGDNLVVIGPLGPVPSG